MRTLSRKIIPSLSFAVFFFVQNPLIADDKFNQLPPPQKMAVLACILAAIVCVKVGVIALMLLTSVLRPQKLRRDGDTIREHPVRSFLAGLLCLAIFVLAVAVTEHLPDVLATLLGVTVVLVCVYLGVCGMCGVAHDIGERVQSNLNVQGVGSTFMTVLWGTILILLVGFVPILGQLVQVVAVTIGVGAVATAMSLRKREQTGIVVQNPAGALDENDEKTRIA